MSSWKVLRIWFICWNLSLSWELAISFLDIWFTFYNEIILWACLFYLSLRSLILPSSFVELCDQSCVDLIGNLSCVDLIINLSCVDLIGNLSWVDLVIWYSLDNLLYRHTLCVLSWFTWCFIQIVSSFGSWKCYACIIY